MRGGVLRREGSHCKHSCPPLCRVKRCPGEHVDVDVGLLRRREYVVGKTHVGKGHPVWRDVVHTMLVRQSLDCRGWGSPGPGAPQEPPTPTTPTLLYF